MDRHVIFFNNPSLKAFSACEDDGICPRNRSSEEKKKQETDTFL
jgi:hypothetical protein